MEMAQSTNLSFLPTGYSSFFLTTTHFSMDLHVKQTPSVLPTSKKRFARGKNLWHQNTWEIYSLSTTTCGKVALSKL